MVHTFFFWEHRRTILTQEKPCSTPPLLYHFYTSTTPLLHLFYTSSTPLLHHFYTSTTPLLHLFYTSSNSFLHLFHTSSTPQQLFPRSIMYVATENKQKKDKQQYSSEECLFPQRNHCCINSFLGLQRETHTHTHSHTPTHTHTHTHTLTRWHDLSDDSQEEEQIDTTTMFNTREEGHRGREGREEGVKEWREEGKREGWGSVLLSSCRCVAAATCAPESDRLVIQKNKG